MLKNIIFLNFSSETNINLKNIFFIYFVKIIFSLFFNGWINYTSYYTPNSLFKIFALNYESKTFL